MATSLEYIEFVCDQIQEAGVVRYRKMFGEYMVYVKKLPELTALMQDDSCGIPYSGAKEHYILDIENRSRSCLSRERKRRSNKNDPIMCI